MVEEEDNDPINPGKASRQIAVLVPKDNSNVRHARIDLHKEIVHKATNHKEIVRKDHHSKIKALSKVLVRSSLNHRNKGQNPRAEIVRRAETDHLRIETIVAEEVIVIMMERNQTKEDNQHHLIHEAHFFLDFFGVFVSSIFLRPFSIIRGKSGY